MAESQPVDTTISDPATDTVPDTVSSESDVEEVKEDGTETAGGSESAKAKNKKKKKSKRAKMAAALGIKQHEEASESAGPAAKMSDSSLQTLLEMNPALKGEFANMPPEKAAQLLKTLNLEQLLTGLSLNKSSQKDMASHKFWQTQPVPQFDESNSLPDGPIKEVVPELVSKDARPLPEGYEWVELDLMSADELKEVYTLLSNHYVEDDNAMFRFSYSQPFLDWALKSPDWKQSWHIGVRAKGKSRLLVATIFGIPTKIRVKDRVIDVVEINFLCIHKKLRAKRLTPVLIKEITRRCHLQGIYQAIYTAGVFLPTPVSTCRYFHRPLQWQKLCDVGFSQLPAGSTPSRMIKRNELPARTSTRGWRPMKESDVDAVWDLLSRFLKRSQLAPDFTRAEIEHWFLNKRSDSGEQVVWAFVVEDEGTSKITDMTSFYSLSSSVIGEASKKHEMINAAYMFYYATETAFAENEKGLKDRLQGLIGDTLIEAKNAGFDVFNALTLHDNPLFLEHLKFGAGDGQLHYYLFNWRTSPISGGVNSTNMPDPKMRGGMGMVLL